MRALAVISLSLCCGFLVAGGSAWNVHFAQRPAAPPSIRGFSGATSWEQATAAARDCGAPLIVLAATTDMDEPSLLDDLRGDPDVRRALEPFVPVVLWLDGPPADRALASRLGCTAAPLLVVLSPVNSTPRIVDALEPVTGATFDRYGLTAELLRAAEGRGTLGVLQGRARMDETNEGTTLALALRLEATGNWEAAAQRTESAREGSSLAQGTLTRYERLRAALRADRSSQDDAASTGAADRERSLEAALLAEDNKTLLFMGWTRVASHLERMAGAAVEHGEGTHLGVPSERWERRLRETTRKAWIACPDELVLPFGALLIERFGRAPRDLDSLDRAFMTAVIRSMAQAQDAGERHGEAWLARSRAALSAATTRSPR